MRHGPRTRATTIPEASRARGRPSLSTRARYAFDNAMARGSGAMVALLMLFLLAVVVVFTLLSVVLGVSPTHPIPTAYNVLLQTIDGNGDLANAGIVAALVFLAITIVGLLIFGAFIGTLVTGMDARLEQLRQGRSVVLEHDSTLILGWSERIFVILSELAIARRPRRRAGRHDHRAGRGRLGVRFRRARADGDRSRADLDQARSAACRRVDADPRLQPAHATRHRRARGVRRAGLASAARDRRRGRPRRAALERPADGPSRVRVPRGEDGRAQRPRRPRRPEL